MTTWLAIILGIVGGTLCGFVSGTRGTARFRGYVYGVVLVVVIAVLLALLAMVFLRAPIGQTALPVIVICTVMMTIAYFPAHAVGRRRAARTGPLTRDTQN